MENDLKCADLRIGNLLKYEDNIVKVFGLRPRYVEFTDKDEFLVGDNPEYFEPIELTEDFFKKHIKKLKEEFIVGNVTSCRLNENISIMFVDGKMNSFYIYDYDDENDSYFSIKIKYLHELQNVFFTFTNQELEIKL